MSLSLFGALTLLRADPSSRPHLDRFLTLAREVLLRAGRRFDDPDEAAQRALLKVARAWTTCRAQDAGRLVAWLRTVASRCGPSKREPWTDDVAALERVSDGRTPEDELLARARHEHLEEALRVAVDLHRRASRADRVQMRRARVSSDPGGLRRDVGLLVALRLEERPVREVAAELDVSEAVARQGAVRGAAAVAIAAGLLAREASVRQRAALPGGGACAGR